MTRRIRSKFQMIGLSSVKSWKRIIGVRLPREWVRLGRWQRPARWRQTAATYPADLGREEGGACETVCRRFRGTTNPHARDSRCLAHFIQLIQRFDKPTQRPSFCLILSRILPSHSRFHSHELTTASKIQFVNYDRLVNTHHLEKYFRCLLGLLTVQKTYWTFLVNLLSVLKIFMTFKS